MVSSQNDSSSQPLVRSEYSATTSFRSSELRHKTRSTAAGNLVRKVITVLTACVFELTPILSSATPISSTGRSEKSSTLVAPQSETKSGGSSIEALMPDLFLGLPKLELPILLP